MRRLLSLTAGKTVRKTTKGQFRRLCYLAQGRPTGLSPRQRGGRRLAGNYSRRSGADLLESTATHIHLQRRLGLPPVEYAHIPVLTGPDGHKLSKQAGAAGLLPGRERGAALWVLDALGLSTALERDFGKVDRDRCPALQTLWAWAAKHCGPRCSRANVPFPWRPLAPRRKWTKVAPFA